MKREQVSGRRSSCGQRGLRGAAIALVASAVVLAAPAGGQERHDHQAMMSAQSAAAFDEHAAHRAMAADQRYQVIEAEYTVPDIMLTDERGQDVDLHTLLSGDRPVAVNFIFTSCTTICP
ncbi:MAG: hypothetical protein OEW16_04005, partial [Gammaproteobacteria bacterium]|nr:hypothetical protein [Gammaproteobacteria bacterium]